MAKGRKKPLLGTPGGTFPDTHRKDRATLSAIDETGMNGNNEETKENDSEQESPKGDNGYEEKLKVDVLVTKTHNPVHVRSQAITVLARLFASDTSRTIFPFSLTIASVTRS